MTFHSNEAGRLLANVSHCKCTLQEFSCKSLFPLSFIFLQISRQRLCLSAGVLSSKNVLHPRPKVHHILKGLWICMFSHLHPNVFLWKHYSVLVVDPKRTPIKTIFIPSNTIFNDFIFRTPALCQRCKMVNDLREVSIKTTAHLTTSTVLRLGLLF